MSNQIDNVSVDSQEGINLAIEDVRKYFTTVNSQFRKINSFIKDISFESRNILTTQITQETNNSQLKLNLEVASGKLQNPNKELTDIYEVILKTTAKVFFNNADQEVTLMDIELEYVSSFYINPDLKNDQIEKVLYVECAQNMLPEIRKLVSEITQYSCWKKIMLDDVKIDLEKMFLEHKNLAANSNAAASSSAPSAAN